MNVLKKPVSIFTTATRLATTNCKEFVNRNPRNLERLRIARKPDGYHLENPGRKFWHKLFLNQSARLVSAQIVHNTNGPVIEAKTSEWAIRKQLYSPKDKCAFINLGRVLAQRCLESGITEVFCDIQPTKGGKVEYFLKELVDGGVVLQEMDVYKKPNPWDRYRPEKPWDIVE